MAAITAANLIKIAAAEIGYKEKASNSSLDDKTANAGSNNWTKYSRDLYAAGYYNGNKNGYAWCDVFVDWCFYQLAGKDAKKAQEIECQTGDCGAGCIYSARYYRNQNRFFTSNPQPGDQIFFGSTGNEEHTGIVETVNGSTITTIEGNSSDQVARKSYSISNSRIVGYGRPKFDSSTVTTISDSENNSSSATVTTSTTFKIGDVVNFIGNLHYSSSVSKVGSKCQSGLATITQIALNTIHPYHLVRVSGGTSTVYGWVNADDVQATTTSATTTTSKEENQMSNSSLVSYTKISPNKSSPRNHAIDTITIHCVVGQCSVETLGNVFAPTSRQASSNYGIGYDGRIGMYVEEKDRSWCSSNAANDNRAITIEVASDTSEPYAVNAKAYAALIDLVTDICKRNGIKKLVWSTNKNERVNHLNGCNMTVHRDYANKSCPGTYLYERHGDIAKQVNARLGATTTTTTEGTTTTTTTSVKAGDIIKLKTGAVYTSGKSIPTWVINSTLYARQIRNDGNIVFSTQQTGAITGVVNPSQLAGTTTTSSSSSSTNTTKYLVKVTADALNIRKGPGTNYAVTGCIKNKGVYTIVETSSNWGRLKSGAGWICLDYTSKV